jgi:hypothetical protein
MDHRGHRERKESAEETHTENLFSVSSGFSSVLSVVLILWNLQTDKGY